MDFSIDKAAAILLGKVNKWVVNFTANIPNLLVAFLIIIVFWFIAKLAKKISSKIFSRLSHDGPVSRLVSSTVQTIVFLIGIFIALGILNLDKTVGSLLAGAGVIGLAIGFAFQEIAANFIAGILIAFRKPYKIGDILQVKEFQGRVSDIDLRTTRLMTFDGLEIIVPNKDMFTSVLTNYTAVPERRVEIEVGVSYSEDLRSVRDIALKALESVGNRFESKAPEVYFINFADSSIVFRARVWIKESDPRHSLMAKNDMVILLKEAFDKNDIMIPFPIRTLDFAIKGGQGLKDVLGEPRAPRELSENI